MRGRTLTAAAMVAMVMGASTANAAISFDLIPVDNSAAMTGYMTYDLQVTTDADWTAAAMLLDLSVGSIYQEPEGWPHAGVTFGPPDPVWFPYFPTAEFDTYLVGDVLTTSIAGGAGDVGGDAYRFDTQELDVSWYNRLETNIGTITIGRLTLTDDAQAQLGLLLTVDADFGEQSVAEFTATITPGASPLVSQVTQEAAARGSDPGESWYEQLLKAWLMPDGSTMWSVGQPSEGAVRVPRDYSQYDYLSRNELFISPTWEQGHVPRVFFAANDNLWTSATDPEPVVEAPTTESGLPEPASLLLITTCLGMIILRR